MKQTDDSPIGPDDERDADRASRARARTLIACPYRCVDPSLCPWCGDSGEGE